MPVKESSWKRCSYQRNRGTDTRFTMRSSSLHTGDVIQIYYTRNPTS